MLDDESLADAHDLPCATKILSDIGYVLPSADFLLRKWAANDATFLQNIRHDYLL